METHPQCGGGLVDDADGGKQEQRGEELGWGGCVPCAKPQSFVMTTVEIHHHHCIMLEGSVCGGVVALHGMMRVVMTRGGA